MTLGDSITLTIAGSGGLTVGGAIGGPGQSLTLAGNGMLTLSGSNTYSGGTTVSGGTLQAGGSGTAFGSVNAPLTVSGATVDLNGTSQGVGSLNGNSGALIVNSGGGIPTLTVGNNNTSGTYAGRHDRCSRPDANRHRHAGAFREQHV